MELEIRNNKYKIIKDVGDTTKDVNFQEIVTDFFDIYDYIVGDWAYGKLRLKGFYNRNNRLVKYHNNIDLVDNYIKNKCAYGCKYFILEKIKNKQI